ncbi:unnamed protein product [Closterium sp. NIES-53]
MVGVVEPTLSLVPEAGEDFEAVATAVEANPMAVLLDSGCSLHLMGTKAVFVDMAPSDSVKQVRGFNGALQPVVGCGTVALQGEAGKRVLIPDVLYVPRVHANLLSAGQLKESGVQLQGDGDGMLLVAAFGEVVGRARYTGRVLCTDLRPYKTRSSSTEVVAPWTIVSATNSTPDQLHPRLAHVGVDTIKSSAKHEASTWLDIKPTIGADPPCVSCVGEKLERHTFHDKGLDVEEALAVVHIDLCGPFWMAAKNGSLYFLLMKDRHTRFVWAMPVAKKSDVLREFQQWLVLIERQTKKTMLMLRSDRGGEFLGKEFTNFVNGKGIVHDLTCPNVHAGPEHRWDIAMMTVKEALASWKGKAVKAAMDEEICSLIGMGTWGLVERPRRVNIMKNRWVLTTKYHIDDTVEREKARLVVKGFTQMYGADYDETYSPVSSYVTLRIFLSIVAILDLNLMQLDMKNAFLQSKLDRVLYMYQPDYFDNGTGRVCKLLKSLYGLKQLPLLAYRAFVRVLLGAGWKKSQVDTVLYFKAGDGGVTCWVLVYVDDLLAASSSIAMLKELKELLCFIDDEQGGRVPKTPVSANAYTEQTFDNEEAQECEEEEYRQKVGSLQFAVTTTRPHIALACSKLGSGLTVRSGQHWREVDRCFAYFAGTRDSALEFGGGPESLELIGYVDADDMGNKHNWTIMGGYVFLDAGKLTVLHVDIKSAITVVEGLGMTGNLKNMERRYAWLQHMVRHGKFLLRYIPTTEQPADFPKKVLHFPVFNRSSVAIGQVQLADVGNGDDGVQQ